MIKKLIFSLILIGSCSVFAVETLTLHHFISPLAPAHKDFLVPWAQQVEQESQGKIKIEIFPSMTMGGTPPELYSQVRDGLADIVWTLIGYTPGVFPNAEVFELPTVHKDSAEATNQAIQDLFDPYLVKDFQQVQVILLHVHTGNAIHSVKQPVRSLQDVRGLKLRVPSRTGAWMIEAWGANPVGMPLPSLAQALAKGTVDGGLIPFEVVAPLKVHELTEYSIEGYQKQRFGTSVFMFAMNKQRFASLPKPLQQIILNNSGRALAKSTGQIWDSIEPKVRSLTAKHSQLIELDATTQQSFDKVNQKVVERWVNETPKQAGVRQQLVNKARDSIEKYSKKD